jgi:hypothetical protein
MPPRVVVLPKFLQSFCSVEVSTLIPLEDDEKLPLETQKVALEDEENDPLDPQLILVEEDENVLERNCTEVDDEERLPSEKVIVLVKPMDPQMAFAFLSRSIV